MPVPDKLSRSRFSEIEKEIDATISDLYRSIQAEESLQKNKDLNKININGEQVPSALASAFNNPSKDKKPFTYFTGGSTPNLSEKPSPSLVRQTETTWRRENQTIPKVLPIVADKDFGKPEPELNGSSTMPLQHLQYNSPLPLYSAGNAAQAYNQQAGQLGGDSSKLNLAQSETYKLIQEQQGAENQPSSHERRRQMDQLHFSGVDRQDRNPSPSFHNIQRSTGDYSFLGSGQTPRYGEMYSPGSGRPKSQPSWTEREEPEVSDHPLDPRFASAIANAERPKVPPPVVPSWAAKAQQKSQKWETYGGQAQEVYQPRTFAPEQPAWSSHAQHKQDRWDQHYGSLSVNTSSTDQFQQQQYQQQPQPQYTSTPVESSPQTRREYDLQKEQEQQRLHQIQIEQQRKFENLQHQQPQNFSHPFARPEHDVVHNAYVKPHTPYYAYRQEQQWRSKSSEPTGRRGKEYWLKPYVAPNIDGRYFGGSSTPAPTGRSQHQSRSTWRTEHTKPAGVLSFGTYYGGPEGFSRSGHRSVQTNRSYSSTRPEDFSVYYGGSRSTGNLSKVGTDYDYSYSTTTSQSRQQPQTPTNYRRTESRLSQYQGSEQNLPPSSHDYSVTNQSQWMARATRLDPGTQAPAPAQQHYQPQQQYQPPQRQAAPAAAPSTYSSRQQTTHSTWSSESEANRQRQEMERELQRRYQTDRSYQSSSNTAVIPASNAPFVSSWKSDGKGASTKAHSEGTYVDPQGHKVDFQKEIYTTSDPGRDFSMLTEQERKVTEEPVQPGVLARHVTTKYYKKSTFNSTTTTAGTQAPPVNSIPGTYRPLSIEAARPITPGVSQF